MQNDNNKNPSGVTSTESINKNSENSQKQENSKNDTERDNEASNPTVGEEDANNS